jgi:hypothetical protein
MANFLFFCREPTERRAKPPEEMQALVASWQTWMQNSARPL